MTLKPRVEKMEQEALPKQAKNGYLIFQQPGEDYEEVYQRDVIDKGIDRENTLIMCVQFVEPKHEEPCDVH